MREDQDRIERLTGDGLSVKMDSNHRVLEVTGDGCRITLTKNCGSVRVVGDGCRVKVTHNVGDIVYTGDGGRVWLGPKSSKEKVQYFGDGGKITFDSESKKRTKSPKNEEANKGSTLLKNYLGTRRDKNREGCEKMSAEMADNLRNERKVPAENKKNIKNTEKTTVFVTTRVTTGNEPTDFFEMEKWFVAPSTVVKSFANDAPAIAVRKKKSTSPEK